jgi:HrpA-like RNA helicase
MMQDARDFEGVVPILDELLEPPDISNVIKSFHYLHESNMISQPDDDGVLTLIGRLAGSLPVDLKLSQIIAYGVMLGVGVESCILSSALSLPKSMYKYMKHS